MAEQARYEQFESERMPLRHNLLACQDASGTSLIFTGGIAVLAVATAGSGHRTAARSAIRLAVERAMQKFFAAGGHSGGSDDANHPAVVLSLSGQAPQFAPPHQNTGLSFSHAFGLSVAALHLDGRIGIDLMRVEPVSDCIRIANDYLGALAAQQLRRVSPAHRTVAFARAWAAHEAQLKCLGWPLQEWSAALADALRTTQTIRIATAPGWCAVVAVAKESAVAHLDNPAGAKQSA